MFTNLSALDKPEPVPSIKELRQFGLILGGIIAGLFGVIFPTLTEMNFTLTPWVLALMLATAALFSPKLLRSVYHYWMKIGDVLGFINTRIILGIVYYGLFVPCGFLMKLLGKDPMKRKIDKNATTYRSYSDQIQNSNSKNMERPY